MKNKYIGILGVIVVIFGILFAFYNTAKKTAKSGSSAEKKLYPVDSFSHAHGLSTDLKDPGKLYIATHEGLYILLNEKDLYQISRNRDDYMGFSPHPKSINTFFSSGHPEEGGNIGFQKSEDGGFTWEKLSDGANGPVDFHAMAVSPVNPNLIFGWYQGVLQKTADGGKNWEVVGPTPFVVVSLTADSPDENTLYASSPQGAFISRDKGQKWQELSTELKNTFVSVIAVNPKNSKEILSFSENLRLARSTDEGKTWSKISESFNDGTVLFISYNRQNPNILYVLTEKNIIYKSTDSGITWKKIR